MKKVEDYVNNLYTGVDPKDPEIKELKEEMKVHLIESVKELQREGYSEEEAMELAIERFGGEKISRPVVEKMLLAQKILPRDSCSPGYSVCSYLSYLSICWSMFMNRMWKKQGI